jgi:hypothetical protein
MVLSVVYDQEFEPIITFAFDAGRSITKLVGFVSLRHLLGTNSG